MKTKTKIRANGSRRAASPQVQTHTTAARAPVRRADAPDVHDFPDFLERRLAGAASRRKGDNPTGLPAEAAAVVAVLAEWEGMDLRAFCAQGVIAVARASCDDLVDIATSGRYPAAETRWARKFFSRLQGLPLITCKPGPHGRPFLRKSGIRQVAVWLNVPASK